MAEIQQKPQLEEIVEAITSAMAAHDRQRVEALIEFHNPAELAHILDALPAAERPHLFAYIPQKLHGEVLLHMGDVAAAELASEMDSLTLHNVTLEMDTADVAELFEILPDEKVSELLSLMDTQRRERVEKNLGYDEGTAGRLMHTDAITVRADVSLKTVRRFLRRLENIPSDTNTLMVVDKNNHFKGVISILDVLRGFPHTTVGEVMHTESVTLRPDMSELEVAQIFQDHDLISAPVLDEEGFFLGRVVVDDIVDLVRDQAEQAIFRSVGLDEEEDLFAPIIPSAKRRAIWLAVNLLTAFLASWAIGLFEATLDKIVALAVLMPIVASMGGIAGSQTLTLTIRGLALGQVNRRNLSWLLKKELGIGLLNGLAWAIVVAIVAAWWFKEMQLGLVIGLALVINMFVAALCGLWIPVILKRMGADPALSGAVVLTTVTDVVGFVSFLGLASVVLL
ncbi:MAG: magnesium transporter [Gammaproteobacteria bacterium]|nr:MAG: magnesium transporter [Gammaproteobacteria bacterium]